MVHALREAHRVLKPGGLLVDARPDSRVLAHAEHENAHGFSRFGTVRTNTTELANDRASDHAIALVVSGGLFTRRRRGRFWHRVPFASLAELRHYLSEHIRFVHRANWIVDEATRRRYANEPFAIRRAVRYDVFSRRATDKPRRPKAVGE
ncbi:MAG TPA: hypothetical protein VJQ08_00035 [Candidatus Dormibacteraeota bacterium]|nr:hypothetical protein [Candidatus Dormibacteraeota bacterium]